MIGILTDVTKCIGCNKCVDACVKENGLGAHIPNKRHNHDGLGSNRWTSIVETKKKRYVRKQCRHCLEPACASACIVGAITKTKEGAVVYDKNKCMGCRYCMMACPFAIPRYSWEDVIPYVRKCKLCYDNRIKQGKQPACTEACPEGATIFGERNKLLAQAHDTLKKNPGKYINKVYGEKEVGGTSVLYISDVRLEFLGWKDDLGETPLPDLTWGVLKKVPYEFIGMGVLMGGIYMFTNRKNKIAQAEATRQENESKENSEQDKEPENE